MDDNWGAAVGLELANLSHTECIGVIRKSGFTSNDAKNAKGAPALITEFIGYVIDATIMDKPTIAITPAKVRETRLAIDGFLDSALVSMPTLRRITGLLLRASTVVKRGRLFVCGILANIRLGNNMFCDQSASNEDRIPITRWCRRNATWWHKYFAITRVPMDLLLPKASFRLPVQGGASGIGYGGLVVVDTTCFYFFGTWTTEEHRLLEANILNINITECLTQAWMLYLFAEFLTGHTVLLECDNLVTVTWLHEQRARTEVAGLLLESMDLTMATARVDGHWVHIKGVNNRLSDELSRNGATDQFLNETRALCPFITQFQDISAKLSPARRDTTWLSSAASRVSRSRARPNAPTTRTSRPTSSSASVPPSPPSTRLSSQ
jgi:hypothetical protein